MNYRKSRLFITVSLIVTIVLPMLGTTLSQGAFPKGYGLFPAQLTESPPGFNKVYFIAFTIFALFLTLFLAFPRLFGFKPVRPPKKTPPEKPKSFPLWFWIALPVTIASWTLMWGRFPQLYPIEHYTFVPLAWGFILVLDGIVYYRTAGLSLLATKPVQFKILILISMLSWFLFEYFNYFVNANWYYPNNHIFTNFGNIVWFFMGYSTVLPVIFEWYTLLKTVPALNIRYSQGPSINFPKTIKWISYLFGLALFVLMSVFPYPLFWAVWVALIPVFGSALSLIGKKTVLSGIASGDWTKVNLIALATLINGFFWEMWNFGSEWIHGFYPTMPGFWMYSVPYVDVGHIFSEMPFLGYYGYLFFGVNCWILWNLSAYILNFKDDIDL